ncbi:hypothetical protein FA15DRAFT_697548 [Coprinopsis marcescibilis]|uniref:Uncharacterized protein n=1 Tax=Coprinopsis marcescibilis TaxID=230819 RepID=A0A5C3KHX5_COPMA|nr:hypothetical protein FA15DRAFT_697548 [Coprinopsis marcescibilis]
MGAGISKTLEKRKERKEAEARNKLKNELNEPPIPDRVHQTSSAMADGLPIVNATVRSSAMSCDRGQIGSIPPDKADTLLPKVHAEDGTANFPTTLSDRKDMTSPKEHSKNTTTKPTAMSSDQGHMDSMLSKPSAEEHIEGVNASFPAMMSPQSQAAATTSDSLSPMAPAKPVSACDSEALAANMREDGRKNETRDLRDTTGSHMMTGASNFAIYGGTFNTSTYHVYGDNASTAREHSVLSPADRKVIVKWLSDINFRAFLADNLRKRAAKTGMWIFKDGKFVRWKGRRKGVLWGTGMPGAGKTILASIIIEYFINLAKENGRTCVAFAFCRYTEELTVEQTLSGLVRQILEDHPSTFAFIIPLYEHHTLRETRPSQTELLGVLNAIASSDLFDNTFCFIDGLDEATSNTQFDLLDTVAQLPINFMFMSRPLPLLKDHVPEADFVDIIVQDADIERLIEDKLRGMKALAKLLEKDGWREKVLTTVLKKSGGMFLVASLQLDMLRSCINIDGLRKALDGLPSGVDAMYSATMERIEAQDYPSIIKRALTWLVHTHRPLSMDDILHAIAIYPDTFKFNPELLLTTDTLLSLCCGLATYEPRSNMVRLVHYTAKDFLKPYLKREYPDPHAMMACTCVEHLLHHSLHVWINPDPDHYDDESAHKAIYQKHPFVDYAHRNWAPHSRLSISLPTPVGNFIRQCHSLLFCGESLGYQECGSAVHVAAILGYHQLLHDWINPTHPTAVIIPPPPNFDINARTAKYGFTPLILAAGNKHLETVDVMLMAEGIDLWCTDNSDHAGWTALMHASFFGHSEIVQSFLRLRDTDCITKYTDGDTRASGGEQAVIGVNITDNDGDSALTLAVFYGHAAEVKMLLGVEGIDVNHLTGSDETALMLASRMGKKEILELIIRHENIDVDIADPQGITALACALIFQKLEIAELLRVHGAREPSVDILEKGKMIYLGFSDSDTDDSD